MNQNSTQDLIGVLTQTDPTEDYYHSLMQNSSGKSALDKMSYCIKNAKLFTTYHRGDRGVWFQKGYPTNPEEPYHLRLLREHALQIERSDVGFNWYYSLGDVPLNLSNLQIICRDEAASEQLIDALESKNCFIPATETSAEASGCGFILDVKGNPIPLFLLKQFNQASLPFIQRRYDLIDVKFAPLKHPPKGGLHS